MPRYVIRIAPDALHAVSRTAFDPPTNLVFSSRERAEGFCDSLNRCLGYQRFIVVELSEEKGMRPRNGQERPDDNGGSGELSTHHWVRRPFFDGSELHA
jgi:hypothetical protein